MPVTLTYDFSSDGGNKHSYIRSMFERLGWKQAGGSTLIYSGRKTNNILQEDWLNDVVPAIMYFRSYLLKHNLPLNKFTLNAMSFSVLDHSSPGKPLGRKPLSGDDLRFRKVDNKQSSKKRIRSFVDHCRDNA